MGPDPNDQKNIQHRREVQRESEAVRLQQEERRLEVARQRNVFAKIINAIYLLVGLLEILLLLRFVLRLFGANTENTFATFIYNLSEPFIAPFSTLFVSPVTSGGASIFDVNVLVAMVVYALLGMLAVWLVRFIATR